jgi:hypothetical protein
MCIDFTYALHIDIFLQCRILHYKTRKALINMLKAIPTYNFINCYATLKKIRNILWTTHGDPGIGKLSTLLG